MTKQERDSKIEFIRIMTGCTRAVAYEALDYANWDNSAALRSLVG